MEREIMKAKTLDRVELTRQKFGMKKAESAQQGLQECPHCGGKSLRLDGGCMSCISCGWSACG